MELNKIQKIGLGVGIGVVLIAIGVYIYSRRKSSRNTTFRKSVLREAYKNLLFETGKDVIKTSSYPFLDKIADAMKENPNTTLSLVGHTDSQGDDNFNLDLSISRAESVKRYLVSQGIDGSRISTDGKGENEPIGDNSTPQGRELNRRVEFSLNEIA